MVEVLSASLIGKLQPIGQVQFLRAEWWKEAPKFVLIRFTINGKEQEMGLRLDLDKQAIIDRFDDDRLNDLLKERTQRICEVVSQMRYAQVT